MPAPTQRDWSVYRVGLTGGIASGKSTVADMFRAAGVPVVDTDQLAREVVVPGSPALAAIRATFGPAMIRADGSLDRAALRAHVFRDPAARRQLEALLHPPIVAAMEARCAVVGGPYQILVVPLLLETGLERRVDRVLVVDCPEAEQRQRLVARDGTDPAVADQILGAQLGRDARLARADDILDNSRGLAALKHDVLALHERYLRLAAGNREPAHCPAPPAGAE